MVCVVLVKQFLYEKEKYGEGNKHFQPLYSGTPSLASFLSCILAPPTRHQSLSLYQSDYFHTICKPVESLEFEKQQLLPKVPSLPVYLLFSALFLEM